MTTLLNNLDKNWRDIIGAKFEWSKMQALEQFLQREKSDRRTVYPMETKIFNALNLTALEDVKVVIIGQDPYFGKEQANGLCFSVSGNTQTIPPSLKNIYREIEDEYGTRPPHGDLAGWAAQGVLLLNATLTVQEGCARSHQGKGWEEFTDAVIRAVNEKPRPVVFLLWGRDAQKKGALITDLKKHLVLKASHPSPLSAFSGRHPFIGCGHFKKANEYLMEHGLTPIEWQKI